MSVNAKKNDIWNRKTTNVNISKEPKNDKNNDNGKYHTIYFGITYSLGI